MNFVAEWDAEHVKREIPRGPPLREVEAFFTRQPKGLRVLDIGCGQGTNTLWLAERGFTVFAFDSSPAAVERLQRAALRAELHDLAVHVVDAAKAWPYDSNIFDIALDVRVLENLSEREALSAYSEVARVLKSGGTFFQFTASEGRPDHYTTCGKVRKISNYQLADWLEALGFRIRYLGLEHRGLVEDWCVEAVKR